MLLSMYRQICWQTLDKINEVRDEAMLYSVSADLDGALIYLEQFAPDSEREHFEQRVGSLFHTRWMTELVETAMLKVKEFPDQGELYYEILSKCYLEKKKCSEGEMIEALCMERSRYYDRKREAVMVFGISLWGRAIANMEDTVCLDNKCNEI